MRKFMITLTVFIACLILVPISAAASTSSVSKKKKNGFYIITGNEYLNTVGSSDITLPDIFTNKKVEGVTLLYKNEFIPADIEIKKNTMTITPSKHLMNEKTYSVRIFTEDENQYVISLKAYNLRKIDFSQDTIVLIPANPEKGFHYPYYLGIPKNANKSRYKRLIVESNNSVMVNDILEFHIDDAKVNVTGRSLAAYVSEILGIPILMPVFPRPMTDWDNLPYMQFLDRKSLLSDDKDMKRADLQLTAMIKDAQKLLEKNNLKVDEKIFMTGFSSSAKFAQRYTVLHPEMVKAIIVGGIASTAVLPLSKYNGVDLRYPVGVSDLKELIGYEFNEKEYKKVAQFMYMSDQDTNDATEWRDCFEEEDAQTIWSLLGRKQLFDRWNNTIKAIDDNGFSSSIQFHMYEGIGHGIPQALFHDSLEFFKKNHGDTVVKIKAHKDAWYWDPEKIGEEITSAYID